ncbi:MAG: hypothetical protein A2X84_07400 [Desulfuromonadaceae bacterium GWC2_58_13]|nr:MAG: hypothetical protein A2X84_07400 [Desulfuromonadaceae bacterium GWC2_58_13]
MKIKLVIGGCLIVLAAAGSSLAGQAQNNCGCGLGSMLWANKADGSILSQTMQVTTNGLFGNQTFGITSGTLGCEQPESIGADDRTFAYVRDNMDGLARDIAVGRGEYLETLAELLAVPEDSKGAFADSLQDNFSQIFVTGEEPAEVILERIVIVAG